MGRKALLVWGGWKGHTPRESTEIMAELLRKEDFTVDIRNKLKVLENYESLTEYDLIVLCWTMGELSSKQEKGLTTAVMDGVGLAGWHGGLCDAFRKNTEYQFMVGAQFVSHPGGAGTEFEVNFVPKKKDDPIIKGLEDFRIKTEQYYMHIDPAVEVLATTTFRSFSMPWIDGVKMPVVYKKRWGDGKIFYISLGHTYRDFDIYQVREVMRRGMLWAAEHEDM